MVYVYSMEVSLKEPTTIFTCINKVGWIESGLGLTQTKMEWQTTHPQILADGSYLGIANTYPEAVIPIRKAPHGHLTEAQKEHNHLLSHDWVIVERFFGRLKTYWGIFEKPYRCEKDSIDALAKICTCLTNLKIRDAPLTSDEIVYNPNPSSLEEDTEDGENEVHEHVQQSPSTPTTRRRKKK